MRQWFFPIVVSVVWLLSATALAQDPSTPPEQEPDEMSAVDAAVDMMTNSDLGVEVSDLGVSEGDVGSSAEDAGQTNNAPRNWSCDPQWYEDGICDCGCSVPDRDCPRGFFDICERSGCEMGEVPWEHRPTSCMRSACGDGWVDDRMGEVCDDGEALDSGGCSADCGSVNPGWTCGIRAAKCESDKDDTNDMGMATVDAMIVDASVPDMVMPDAAVVDAASIENPTPDAATALGFPASDTESSDGCSSGGPVRGNGGTAICVLLSLLLCRVRATR